MMEHLFNIERDGLTFSVSVEYDSSYGPPWRECDGHGPVREVSGESCYTRRPVIRAGEKLLTWDRGFGLAYDVAEAQRIALRDGWGIDPATKAHRVRQLGRPMTRGECAAAAVERDFDYLRRWCADEWHYVMVCVELLDVDGDGTGECAYLGGVDYDAGSEDSEGYIRECAADLAHDIAPEGDYLERSTGARFERFQIREVSAPRQYLVEWKIDIDADNPEEAAVQAFIAMRDPESTATVFHVTSPDGAQCVVDVAGGGA